MRVPKGILPAGALLPLEEKNGALGLLDAEVSGRCREKVKGGLLEKRAPASHR